MSEMTAAEYRRMIGAVDGTPTEKVGKRKTSPKMGDAGNLPPKVWKQHQYRIEVLDADANTSVLYLPVTGESNEWEIGRVLSEATKAGRVCRIDSITRITVYDGDSKFLRDLQ